MRKGNMTILASVLAMLLVAGAVGAGTMAYFNEIDQATGNTFTAGYLDIELHDGSAWVDGPISGFWSTPTNWAPGETYTRRLYFRNEGNVPVQVVLLDFKNYQYTVASTFWDVIEVVSVKEHYEGEGTNYVPGFMDDWLGDGDSPLTLHELMVTPNDEGTVGNCDAILFATFEGPCTDPECTATNIALMGGNYLAPGQEGWLEIGFKFSSTATSIYEGATCSFDLQMSFIQGPTSGVCRHELPGFIPGP